MSERGSFVTEYIYCGKCLEAVKRILLSEKPDKYFAAYQVPFYKDADEYLPIIAGKIGGLYSGEELHYFNEKFFSALEHSICHDLRVAILCDDETKSRILTIEPYQDRHNRYVSNPRWIGDDYLVIERFCADCGILLGVSGTRMFRNPPSTEVSEAQLNLD